MGGLEDATMENINDADNRKNIVCLYFIKISKMRWQTWKYYIVDVIQIIIILAITYIKIQNVSDNGAFL